MDLSWKQVPKNSDWPGKPTQILTFFQLHKESRKREHVHVYVCMHKYTRNLSPNFISTEVIQASLSSWDTLSR